MYPSKNVNLSQFYSVPPPQTYSSHGYPYSMYFQPNSAISIATSTQKSSPAPYLGEPFSNNESRSGLGTTAGGTNVQEFFQRPNVPETKVNVALPKYFRCTLGEGPSRYRRERTVFTQNQLRAFEKRFETQKYLSTQERFELARSLGLSALQVKTWFQNRRMKWKKTTKGRLSGLHAAEKAKQAKQGGTDLSSQVNVSNNQLSF